MLRNNVKKKVMFIWLKQKNKNKFKQYLIGVAFFFAAFFALPGVVGATGCQYYSPGETQSAPIAGGATYIIDGTNGTDPANCAAPGASWGTVGNTPYKTIACAMNRYVARTTPRFLIHGGKYNERFSVPNTWTYGNDEAHRTVIAAYGDEEVIVDGSVTKNLGSWSQYNGSIYQATFSVAPVNGLAAMAIDDEFRSYHPAASLAGVNAPGMWFYDSGTRALYVWPAAEISGSLSGHDIVAVEKDVDGTSKYGISINPGVNYLTISGLTVRGNPGANIFADAISPYNDHLKIENCKIEFSAKSGIWLAGSTNAEVLKNYIFANVLRNWPRGSWASTCSNYTAGGWPPAAAFLSNTNHVFEGNIISWSNGEGLIFIDNGTYGNGIAKNNIVHDSYSTNMYFDHGLNSTFRSNIVYSQTPDPSDIRQNGCTAGDVLALTRRSRAAGIASANEAYASVPPIGSGNNILNNIVIGTRRGIGNGDETTGGGLRNENILNNTIIVPNYDPLQINDAMTGLSVGYNSGNNFNAKIKNNLVIATNPNTSVASWEAAGNPSDTGVSWNNNLYYHPNNGTAFSYKGVSYNFSNWQAQATQEANALFTDPQMTRSDWGVSFSAPIIHPNQCWDANDYLGVNINDLILKENSPAISAGDDSLLSIVGDDFLGNVRSVGNVSIGALQYVLLNDLIAPSAPSGLLVQ
jgi:hypothetical protein